MDCVLNGGNTLLNKIIFIKHQNDGVDTMNLWFYIKPIAIMKISSQALKGQGVAAMKYKTSSL